jgi:hypothetical protein
MVDAERVADMLFGKSFDSLSFVGYDDLTPTAAYGPDSEDAPT